MPFSTRVSGTSGAGSAREFSVSSSAFPPQAKSTQASKANRGRAFQGIVNELMTLDWKITLIELRLPKTMAYLIGEDFAYFYESNQRAKKFNSECYAKSYRFHLITGVSTALERFTVLT